MNTNYEKVKEFHKQFGHPAPDVLHEESITDTDLTDLRVALIQEELNELKEAISNNDIIEVADALADIL
jgi:predicted HAD superfamily Cof-like phosphohydrolase